MNQSSLDRNLLFGVLALQVDLIDGDQLVAATAKWASEKGTATWRDARRAGRTDGESSRCLGADGRRARRAARRRSRRSLAALSSTEQVLRRSPARGHRRPELQAGLSRLGDVTLAFAAERRPQTISAEINARSIGPPAHRAVDSACCVLTHAEGSARFTSPGTTSWDDRSPSRRSSPTRPPIPNFGPGSCSRPRSTETSNIPESCPSTAWAPTPDGRPFYAMRFIEGDSLKEAIERFHIADRRAMPCRRRTFDSLEFRQLLRRFVDVCNAIAYAHSRGVLHRDLKPANVMLGQYGETLIIDWGLAKATGQADPGPGGSTGTPLLPASGSSIEQTEAGNVLGTPAYMSPEQAVGPNRRTRTGQRSIQPGRHALRRADRSAAGGGRGCRRDPVAIRSWRHRSSKVGRAGRAPAPRGHLPKGAGTAARRTAIRMPRRSPTTWSGGWPTSRSPPIASPGSTGFVAGDDATAPWSRRPRPPRLSPWPGSASWPPCRPRARQQLSIKNEQLTSANLARGRALDKANARVELALEALEQFREAVDANLDVQNRPENAPLRNELLQMPLAFFRTLRDDLRDDPAARPEDHLKLADAQLELARLTRDIGNQASALEAVDEAVATLEALATDRRLELPSGPGETETPGRARPSSGAPDR